MRDHQKTLFPGAAKEGCFFHLLDGSFLMSLVCHLGQPQNIRMWLFLVILALSQNVVQLVHKMVLDKPHNLGLMSVHLKKINLLNMLL